MAALKFMNLLDRSQKLSITNLGVWLLLIKVTVAPTMDWTVVAGLLVTLLNYSHKRASEVLPTTQPTELDATIAAIKKTAEDAKDISQKVQLAIGMTKLK